MQFLHIRLAKKPTTQNLKTPLYLNHEINKKGEKLWVFANHFKNGHLINALFVN